MYIQKNLIFLRSKSSLGLRELARSSNADVSTLHKIESGKIKDPTISTMSKIASAFGVSIDSFVNEDLEKLEDAEQE